MYTVTVYCADSTVREHAVFTNYASAILWAAAQSKLDHQHTELSTSEDTLVYRDGWECPQERRSKL